MSEYTLERTLPNGQTRTQGPVTRKVACGLAAFVLTDNTQASRAAALAIAARLDHAPDGEAVESHGYSFRLVKS